MKDARESEKEKTGGGDEEKNTRENEVGLTEMYVCVLTRPWTELCDTKTVTCNMAALHQNSIDDDRLYLSNSSAGQTFVLTMSNICSVYSRLGDMFILSAGYR